MAVDPSCYCGLLGLTYTASMADDMVTLTGRVKDADRKPIDVVVQPVGILLDSKTGSRSPMARLPSQCAGAGGLLYLWQDGFGRRARRHRSRRLRDKATMRKSWMSRHPDQTRASPKGRVVLSDGKPIPDGMKVTISSERAWDTQIAMLPPEGLFEFGSQPR
jgi:hypothetical protein